MSRPPQRGVGSCHCGVVRYAICGARPFHRKRVSPDFFGINTACLENLDPAGIALPRAVEAATP